MDVLLRNITLKFSNKFDVFFKFISSNFHHEALNTKSDHIVVDLTTTDSVLQKSFSRNFRHKYIFFLVITQGSMLFRYAFIFTSFIQFMGHISTFVLTSFFK